MPSGKDDNIILIELAQFFSDVAFELRPVPCDYIPFHDLFFCFF